MRRLFSPLRLAGWAALLGLGGCIDAYMPDVVEAPNSYLVVDGFINGAGRTRIQLTRSMNVASVTAIPAVRGALVYIVDNTGVRYQVRESGSAGSYVSDSLQLNAGRQYKLRITVGNLGTAPVYESELVPLKVTPPFARLEFVRREGQLQLLLSTRDPAGQARYYRWGHTQTWEFNSAYPSAIEYRGGIIQSRITPIYTCWRTDRSSLVQQASTASLSEDVVQDQQLLSFSDHAERLQIRYTILVTQYAETAQEFAYNEVLRKNTEAVGTVNDPLPSQLTGNVHRLNGNTAEPVLGFVGAHTLVQRRLWLTPASLGLPANWVFESPYNACQLVEEPVPDPEDNWPNIIYPPHTRVFAQPNYVPTRALINPITGDTLGYTGSTRFCVDCRERGSNMKPSFW